MTVEINNVTYLTLEEAANKFNIGRDYFRRKYLASGKISASKTGKRWFIRAGAIEEFLSKIER